jgi:malonate-semialdehyde dehydrogenase (acetylating)/methylmalonate-semialdehyde dehydrogenase
MSHWIAGTFVASTSGRAGVRTNPTTGAAIAEVAFASAEEFDSAVEAAKAVQTGWRSAPLSRRAEVMFQLCGMLVEHRQELDAIISRENGKTIADALGEVARGLENVEFACGVSSMLKGGFSEQASRGVGVYIIRQPLRVVAGITPFNFPVMVPL